MGNGGVLSRAGIGRAGIRRARRCSTVLGRLSFIAACAAGSGCALFGSMADDAPPAPQANAGSTAADTDSGDISDYLEMIDQLIDGDALTRSAAFADAENDAAFLPTTENRLRYAIALAIPDHPGSDLQAAAARLRDLLAVESALLPAERILAQLLLNNVNALLILEQSRDELQASRDAALAARDEETATLIEQLRADNQRLNRELKDATEMLDAITSIEESISEREDQ